MSIWASSPASPQGVPVSPVDAYFQANPDDEGFMASQVATVLGLGGYAVGRVPHPAAKVAAAIMGGSSFGIKVGVHIKGDSVMINNPYYNPSFAYAQRRIDFYP